MQMLGKRRTMILYPSSTSVGIDQWLMENFPSNWYVHILIHTYADALSCTFIHIETQDHTCIYMLKHTCTYAFMPVATAVAVAVAVAVSVAVKKIK